MTESEWLECDDPQRMLRFLQGEGQERRLQLFVCAACRRYWPLLEEECLRGAVEISERYADGTASRAELARAAKAVWLTVVPLPESAPGYHVAWAAAWSTVPQNRYFADNAGASLRKATGGLIEYLLKALGILSARQERRSQAGLLRDIFGTPFYTSILDGAWLNPTVSNLARSAYDERALPSGELDPDRLAVLSDALEEAGCDDDDVLDHLRSPGPHVRGCWAVDLLLGKE